MYKTIQQISSEILKSKKYKDLYPVTVDRIVSDCINKYGEKKAEKEARNKLHQIWGAYWPTRPDFAKVYSKNSLKLREKPSETLIELMQLQSSTKERIPLLQSFYQEIFKHFSGEVSTISDFACGLNPLTYLWIPNCSKYHINAYDIDLSEIAFLNSIFENFTTNFQAQPGDILSEQFEYSDVVFLLKTLPCLEQQQKGASELLLQKLQCKYIVVTFPTKSIGGKNKGMEHHYAKEFESILKQLKLKSKKIEFESELVYLITK